MAKPKKRYNYKSASKLMKVDEVWRCDADLFFKVDNKGILCVSESCRLWMTAFTDIHGEMFVRCGDKEVYLASIKGWQRS